MTTPGATSTVTKVLWNEVSDSQLEEVLYSLLEAMGANRLVWRSGTNSGINAADGGRDLEATFNQPTPDGELEQQKWWIECKRRSSTLEKSAVQNAVNDALASDIDVLVIATSSRFSNPTRDWVDSRVRDRQGFKVRLWDRDKLDSLVRKYPEIAARILPTNLPDSDRLRLLTKRFSELGEEPTVRDADYFWSKRDWLKEQDETLFFEAIGTFLYFEGIRLPRKRPWWSLIDEGNAAQATQYALVVMPCILPDEKAPRPTENMRAVAAISRILLGALQVLPAESVVPLVCSPWNFIKSDAVDLEVIREHSQNILPAVLAFMRSELVDPCSTDCLRVTGDPVHEPDSLTPKDFWPLIHKGELRSNSDAIMIEFAESPCTIGFNMENGCPLVVSNEINQEDLVAQISLVLTFRSKHPDQAAKEDKLKHLLFQKSGSTATMVYNHGMEYKKIDTSRDDSS